MKKKIKHKPHGLVCSNPGCMFSQTVPVPKEGDPCVWCKRGKWVQKEKIK